MPGCAAVMGWHRWSAWKRRDSHAGFQPGNPLSRLKNDRCWRCPAVALHCVHAGLGRFPRAIA